MEVFFWICMLIVFYSYLGYPLLLHILSHVCVKPVAKEADSRNLPIVTVVVAALNEEANIIHRLENIFEQDYPMDRLEVIVVSDGSTDKTNDLVKLKKSDFWKNERVAGLQFPSLKLISYSPSRGKAYAINQGVMAATGQIVVFADCRQKFATNAIRELVANFSDSSIGCVSGELIFLDDLRSNVKAEMGVYWKYEKWVRKMESMSGSVVGATGAIYAIRKKLFRKLPSATLLDDVLTPMNIVMQRSRVIFDSCAVAYDVVAKDAKQEWKRKVRTLTGNWQLIMLAPEFFSPIKNPIWWRFISHKFSRLIVPFVLPCILLSCLQLNGIFYESFALFQILFYLLALVAAFSLSVRKFQIASLAYFFCVLNFAVFWGCYKFITGQSNQAWKPVKYRND